MKKIWNLGKIACKVTAQHSPVKFFICVVMGMVGCCLLGVFCSDGLGVGGRGLIYRKSASARNIGWWV